MRELMQDDTTARAHGAIVGLGFADTRGRVGLEHQLASEDGGTNNDSSGGASDSIGNNTSVLGTVGLRFCVVPRASDTGGKFESSFDEIANLKDVLSVVVLICGDGVESCPDAVGVVSTKVAVEASAVGLLLDV